MEIDDRDDFILLDPRAYPDVFEVLRKDVLPMSSARDSVVDDQAHHCLEGVVSSLNLELRSDVFS